MPTEIRATIFRKDYTDDGPVETIHREFAGTQDELERELEMLNEAKFRKPRHPLARIASGELFHPPSEFRSEPRE